MGVYICDLWYAETQKSIIQFLARGVFLHNLPVKEGEDTKPTPL